MRMAAVPVRSVFPGNLPQFFKVDENQRHNWGARELYWLSPRRRNANQNWSTDFSRQREHCYIAAIAVAVCFSGKSSPLLRRAIT
jgi:hypothetical protein